MAELAFERTFRLWGESAGVRWTRLRYSRPDVEGETTAYRLIPPGPPRAIVLAVHGAGNDALFGWVGLFKRLLLRGFEIFTFDLEGHGRFSTTRFSPDTASRAIAEAVRRSEAPARGLGIHAIGVSLGGAVLLHALPTQPAITSAVLLAAPLRIQFSWNCIRGELGIPLLRTLWREREHYGLTGLIPSFGPVKRTTYPLRLSEDPGAGGFGYVDVLNRALERMRLEEAARAVRVPVLLVYGGSDRLVPPEQGARLAGLIPHAELLRLEGESHLTAPLAPAAVERVVEWMESAPPPIPHRTGEGSTAAGEAVDASPLTGERVASPSDRAEGGE